MVKSICNHLIDDDTKTKEEKIKFISSQLVSYIKSICETSLIDDNTKLIIIHAYTPYTGDYNSLVEIYSKIYNIDSWVD